ncbi:flagellar motor protein [Natranaerobius thermophilus]|uniref:MotA/TolQ/ExbB proton channel n=1 Tax=Natranaerobius thermophilus (strain ATCC BAA-1301 / DSM 18059 / JW/NM-WN-LF) TaxID=457570 RepID=B2A355_NATTJ|nr:flagellar motor protein [Natranaerobius thermophilus]ACB84985.1 MotA/TolQ/ExbB proton channel [Natranaerobius thermophilus JW/NM-WN-LF]
MDIATIIGLIAGVFLLIGAVFLEGNVDIFFNIPSALIVIGGTVAATLISYPINQFFSIVKTVQNAFKVKSMNPTETINLLVNLAEKARREGLLALEDDVEEMDDDFLKKGVQLVVDGTDPELVRSILETELSFQEERHKIGQNIFRTMGTFSPAFGMSGTLIGLVSMLDDLDDPDAIGPGMALALLTTLYGVVAANLIFLPIANKLEVKSNDEILLKEVMLEGMLSIQAGENPRIVEEKLKAFLAPKSRDEIAEEDEEVVDANAEI